MDSSNKDHVEKVDYECTELASCSEQALDPETSEMVSPSPPSSVPLTPHRQSFSELEGIEFFKVDFTQLKTLMMAKSCSATAMPLLITLVGLPGSEKTNVLADLLEITHENYQPIATNNEGIILYEMIACRDRDRQLRYRITTPENCYIFAVYSALKHQFRVHKQLEYFPDVPLEEKAFKDPCLDGSFRRLHVTLKNTQEGNAGLKFDRFFEKNLASGFAAMNIWDIGLSKTVFHFLPFLSGKLTSNHLWLFFRDQDLMEAESFADIPFEHRDHQKLMLFKSRLYYLLRNVHLTSKVKKTSEKPQCTFFLTSNKTIYDEQLKVYKDTIESMAKRMKIEHLIDIENIQVLDAATDRSVWKQKLHECRESIIHKGLDSCQKNLPLSWIFLRNIYCENRSMYIYKKDMEELAKQLSVDFEDFLSYFSSFGSIIDTSEISKQLPYIITNPSAFFRMLDERLFYPKNSKSLQRYGLISQEAARQIQDSKFLLQVLKFADLAIEFTRDELIDESNNNLLNSTESSVFYYIPLAIETELNTECTHSALHLHLTLGRVLCRNMQVKFVQIFFKENPGAKMILTPDVPFANCTLISFKGNTFKYMYHGNEAEFIFNDKNDSKEFYQPVINALYSMLKEFSKHESYLKFSFSFLCCKTSKTSSYSLKQVRHLLPISRQNSEICQECQYLLSEQPSLKLCNKLLEEEKWMKFPQYENEKNETMSSVDVIQFNQIGNLSTECVDKLAKLLKCTDSKSLKGYDGWRRIYVMILEWERDSNFDTWQTMKLFREKLEELRDMPSTPAEDKYKIEQVLLIKDVAVQFHYEILIEDGVCVVDKKVFHIQGSDEQSFDWNECGFSLHVPEGALLGTETCSVAVKALVAGNFKFPDNTQLISGIYSISATREFRKPVCTIIQHCLKVEKKNQIERMYFIKAHHMHKGLPYAFRKENGGEFEIDSQYGSFWQKNFCYVGIVLENQILPVPNEDEDINSTNSDHETEECADNEETDTYEQQKNQEDDSFSTTDNNLNEVAHQSDAVLGKTAVTTAGPVDDKLPAEATVNQLTVTDDDLLGNETEDTFFYCALTFYKKKARNRYSHKFVAVKNLQLHIKYVHTCPLFSLLERGEAFFFTFLKSSPGARITLKFKPPEYEANLDGWHVEPESIPSFISKRGIDSLGQEFQIQGQNDVQVYPIIPVCLTNVYAESGTTANLRYPVALEGIDPSLTIYIQRFIDDNGQDSTEPSATTSSTPSDQVSQFDSSSASALKSTSTEDIIAVVKSVLSKNENRLGASVKYSLDEFASKLLEYELIDRAVARNPTYTKVIDQFFSAMEYMEEQKEVEEHCIKLLRALKNLGGMFDKPSDIIRSNLIQEMKNKLNVNFHLN